MNHTTQILAATTLLAALFGTSWLSYQMGTKVSNPIVTASPLALANPSDALNYKTVLSSTRSWQDVISATGSFSPQPSLQSQVGAPASGRVAQVMVNVGDHVKAGQVLVTLQSQEVSKAAAEAHHARIRLKLAEHTLSQRRQLARLGDASRRPVEEARNEYAAGVSDRDIAQAAVDLAKKKLARTQDLLSHGISTTQQLEEDQSALQECQARLVKTQGQLEVAIEHRKREEQVAASRILIAPKIMEAETETELAREELEHSQATLRNYGLTDEESPVVPLRAATDGVVVKRNVSLGQWVSAEQELLQIVDISKLDLWISLPEKDRAKVKIGMKVNLPEVGGSGILTFLSPQLEAGTLSQRGRVEVQNLGRLKAGMFTKAEVQIGLAHQGVTVPSGCIQSRDNQNWVYLETEPGKYTPQKVTIGLQDRKTSETEILEGLKVGQKVVNDGSYFLHSASAKE